MGKRPTPKKKRAKRATRLQHSHFKSLEIRRLTKKSLSPYAAPAKPKATAAKSLKKITRYKA